MKLFYADLSPYARKARAMVIEKDLSDRVESIAVNPYEITDDVIVAQLITLGAREEYLDFQPMLKNACPDFEAVDWAQVRMRAMVGASEIQSGAETVFDTRKNQEDDYIPVKATEVFLLDQMYLA